MFSLSLSSLSFFLCLSLSLSLPLSFTHLTGNDPHLASPPHSHPHTQHCRPSQVQLSQQGNCSPSPPFNILPPGLVLPFPFPSFPIPISILDLYSPFFLFFFKLPLFTQSLSFWFPNVHSVRLRRWEATQWIVGGSFSDSRLV